MKKIGEYTFFDDFKLDRAINGYGEEHHVAGAAEQNLEEGTSEYAEKVLEIYLKLGGRVEDEKGNLIKGTGEKGLSERQLEYRERNRKDRIEAIKENKEKQANKK